MPATKTLNTAKQNQAGKGVEYIVYIHHSANQNNRFWERTSITSDAELALEQAEMLYDSQKYPKVEVKRKFFCERRNKKVSVTLKTFEIRAKNAAPFQYIKKAFMACVRYFRPLAS